jgi:hypothetical protein
MLGIVNVSEYRERKNNKNFIDETNKRYKTFTAISFFKRKDKIYWVCKCDCGFEKIIYSSNLRRGHFLSCSCDPESRNHISKDHEGETHYMWHIKERVSDNKKGVYHRCVCDCGNEKVVEVDNILRAYSKCCGCLGKENIKNYVLNIKKKPYNIAALNELYERYKRNANHRNLDFSLSKECFEVLIKNNCFYCGEVPLTIILLKRKEAINNPYLFNGIDRLDNNKGYIEDNVVTCCKKCNIMKHVLKKDDFINHVGKIYNNLKDKL